ncbi:MAG TPA: LysE family transporter [Bryobacteraceae bacterium]|nr:LysE family transporter [Bryobacteraceae bacterium]
MNSADTMLAAMTNAGLLARGVACGVIIAAPVGPVNVLCVQRTITKGWRSGLLSGLGSALADTIYGAVAGFSISFVIAFLISEVFWIRLFGGIVLIGLGVLYYFRSPASVQQRPPEETGHSDYVSTFFLTLTNPTTVLSFLAVLAALGLGHQRAWWLTFLVVFGIFIGSMVWWFILTGVVNRVRDRISGRTMLWVNRAGGLAIGTFGLITLTLSLASWR